jgi:hypothetical protein
MRHSEGNKTANRLSAAEISARGADRWARSRKLLLKTTLLGDSEDVLWPKYSRV